MTGPQETPDVEAMIADLVELAAGVANAVRDDAEMLTELLTELAKLLAERPESAERAAVAHASPLPADVLQVAALHASAAGMSVEDYLRDAVTAYGARHCHDAGIADGDLGDRLREARDDARRVRDESKAVAAQSAQAAAHRAQLNVRAHADGRGAARGSNPAPSEEPPGPG
jgi:hypothetical protein